MMIYKFLLSFSLIVHSGDALIRNDALPSRKTATQLLTNFTSRRCWIADAAKSMMLVITTPVVGYLSENAYAAETTAAQEQFNPDDPEFKELYDNPSVPQQP